MPFDVKIPDKTKCLYFGKHGLSQNFKVSGVGTFCLDS